MKMLIDTCLQLLKLPITIGGFTFSFWVVALTSLLLILVSKLIRGFFR